MKRKHPFCLNPSLARGLVVAIASTALYAIPASAQQKAALSAEEQGRLLKRISPYLEKVKKQPDWLYSRLQMYWTTHATDVYIYGEQFDHAGGPRADVATVKYNGTRSTASSYNRPRLEDIVPYDDDEQSQVTFISRATGKMEKAHPAKTGCNIEGVNREILGIARDAARLYAATGDTAYAAMALPVLDVFLRGLGARNVPKDLNHGHQQTLVGMTTFEVIHEDAINQVTECLRALGSYAGAGRKTYEAALKKWAENIIAGGVPHNNWNLFQADFIGKIAMALQDDSAYDDGHGRQYYLDYITRQNSIRQWSLKHLADYGFGPAFASADTTHAIGALWSEAPGYSRTVVNQFTELADRMDRDCNIDLFKQIPALKQSVFSLSEYLFPNRMIAGFGDTHPDFVNHAATHLLNYARRNGQTALADSCLKWTEAMQPQAPATLAAQWNHPVVYAPKVSWVALRTGMDPKHDLMVSTNGSLGNHQHANGISCEFYGKGYVLGLDAGIGRTLYSGLDYLEYYSQFPAHNTVCVDGVSSYPVMMSQHAFHIADIQAYDISTDENASLPVRSQTLEFTEPETDARQQRTTAIVKTSPTGGFYIDIFRSKRRDGHDKMHDYFYHNLGQSMTLTASDGTDLALKPTEELAFAGGHLYAYSYIFDKKMAETDKSVLATFSTQCKDGRQIDMRLWMKGDTHRQVFQALSPVNLEYERMANQPYPIKEQPVQTYVARQYGEAWEHPFVAILEPSDSDEPGEIQSVDYFQPESKDKTATGIRVTLKNGQVFNVFSSASGAAMKYGKTKVKGYLKVVAETKHTR